MAETDEQPTPECSARIAVRAIMKRLATDISHLPKAPDIEFEIQAPHVITAEVDGFSVRIEAIADDRAHVRLSLNGEPYCQCEYIYTRSPHFQEEDITAEVTGFASGIVWSAWRRRALGSTPIRIPEDHGKDGG